MPVGHIVASTDLTPASGAVSRYACALARQLGARLTLINVAAPREFAQDGTSPWGTARRQGALHRLLTARGVEAQARVLAGTPACRIRDATHALGADMLVIGRGEERFHGAAVGRTARYLLEHVRAPALVVPPLAPDEAEWFSPEINHLVAMDTQDRASELGVQASRALARELRADADCVSEGPRAMGQRPGDARTRAEALLQAALDLDARVITVPAHGRLHDLRAPLSEFTEELLIQSPVPVLVYPARYLIQISNQPGGEDLAA